jgi:hypothetical protein
MVPILIELGSILMSGGVFWKASSKYLSILFGLTNILHPWLNLKVRLG